MAAPVPPALPRRAKILGDARGPARAGASSLPPFGGRGSVTTIEAETLPTPPPTPVLAPGQCLWRLRLPAENHARLEIAEQALSAALCSDPRRGCWPRRATDEALALELEGRAEQVHFALRGPRARVERVFAQLVAGYRQVERSPLEAHSRDPLILAAGEGASYAELHLAEDAALPLSTPESRAFAEGTDPLSGILQALARTPAELRVVCQLVIGQGRSGWGNAAARRLLALTRPERGPRAWQREQLSDLEWALLFLLPPAALIGWLAAARLLWWLWFIVPLLLSLLGVIVYGLVRRERTKTLLQLHAAEAAEKLKERERVLSCCLRLSVIGPVGLGRERERCLKELLDLYSGAFAGANRLVARRRGQIRVQIAGAAARDRAARQAMRDLALAFRPRGALARLQLWLGGARARPVLSPRELATLWHLPHTADDVSYLDLSPSQQRLAPPGLFTIAPALLPEGSLTRLAHPGAWSPAGRKQLDGFFAGLSQYAGASYPIRFPTSVLEGHIAVVGATGSGKSTFLQQLVHWAIADGQMACIILDPHNDLCGHVRGLVTERDVQDGRVVVIDPTDAMPVGFASLWDADPVLAKNAILRQEMINNVVTTMERLSDGAWGQRVRSNFQLGLSTLMEASAADLDAGRPVEAHTLLDLYPLFTRAAYRDGVLARLEASRGVHTELRGMWTYQHGINTPAQELQEIGSVLNRIAPLLLGAGGLLLGQRAPRFSWRAAIRERKLCLVSLGGLGADARRSVGSLLLSYLQGTLLSLQAEPWHARRPVLLVVDELQAFDPNALLGLFGEVRKFGGRVVVATNSVKRLELESPALARELDANVGTWVVGRVGANDGDALLWRLQGDRRGPLTLADLMRLPRRHFFASALVDGQPTSVFRFETPPYVTSNEQMALRALVSSRNRYGQPRAEVEAEIHQVARALEVTRILEDKRQHQQAAARAAGRQSKRETGAPTATPAPATPDPQDATSPVEAVVRQVARTSSGPARQKPPPAPPTAASRRTHPRRAASGGSAPVQRDALFSAEEPA